MQIKLDRRIEESGNRTQLNFFCWNGEYGHYSIFNLLFSLFVIVCMLVHLFVVYILHSASLSHSQSQLTRENSKQICQLIKL